MGFTCKIGTELVDVEALYIPAMFKEGAVIALLSAITVCNLRSFIEEPETITIGAFSLGFNSGFDTIRTIEVNLSNLK